MNETRAQVSKVNFYALFTVLYHNYYSLFFRVNSVETFAQKLMFKLATICLILEYVL